MNILPFGIAGRPRSLGSVQPEHRPVLTADLPKKATPTAVIGDFEHPSHFLARKHLDLLGTSVPVHSRRTQLDCSVPVHLRRTTQLDRFSTLYWNGFLSEFTEAVRHAIEAEPDAWTSALKEGSDPGVRFLQALGFIFIEGIGQPTMAMYVPRLEELLRKYDGLQKALPPGVEGEHVFRIYRPVVLGSSGRMTLEELGSLVGADEHPAFPLSHRMHIALVCWPASFKPGSDRNFGGTGHFVRNLAGMLAKAGHRVDLFSGGVIDPGRPGFEPGVEVDPEFDNLVYIRIGVWNPDHRGQPAEPP